MTARVIDDVPPHTFFVDIIRKQYLREVSVPQLLVLGHRHDFWTCLIINLPCHGWQTAVAARGQTMRRPSASSSAPWSSASSGSEYCQDGAPPISSAASICWSRSRQHRGCRWQCCAGARVLLVVIGLHRVVGENDRALAAICVLNVGR